MLVQILVPIAVCVVLPVLIVWIIFRAQMNGDNKRAEVLIEAIKSNNSVDTDRLINALDKPRKTSIEILNGRLLRGCILSLVGLLVSVGSVWMKYEGYLIGGDFSLFLTIGLICLAIGIGFLIVYFVTKKQLPLNTADNQE